MNQQQGTPPEPHSEPSRNILSKEPFVLDMPAVHAWFAEQAGKVGTPMTPKEMERWDEKSRAAWSGVMA